MDLGLPPSIAVEVEDDVALVTLNRAHKRNALDNETLQGLGTFFSQPPAGVRAAVIQGAGAHFCSGLDLNSLTETSIEGGLRHSQMWHRAMATIEQGSIPVFSVLTGAVVGGGLELASATHIRIADTTAFYALPEGQRGLFLGGGGSVRLPQLIGAARMTDMMLTGRVYTADEGHTAGLTQYLVPDGEGRAKAMELAKVAATVAPMTTFAVLQALPRIAAANPTEGYLLESLMSAVAQSTDEAKARMQEFLSGRAARLAAPPVADAGP